MENIGLGDFTGWASFVISGLALCFSVRVNYRASLPNVLVYLEHDRDHNMVELVVANRGQGIATDVILSSIDKDMVQEELREDVSNSFIARGIGCLVPGSECRTVINMSRNVDDLADKSCFVKVAWTEYGMVRRTRRASSDFKLSYGSLVGSVYPISDSTKVVSSLNSIKQSASSISGSLSRIALVSSGDCQEQR